MKEMRLKTISCCFALAVLLGASLCKMANSSTEATNQYRYEGEELHHQIRSYLSAMKELYGANKNPLPAKLTDIIIVNQPESGDFLLSIIAHSNNPLRRRAINAFIQTWDTMNLQQIDGYIHRAIELKVDHRKSYPEKVSANMGVGYSSVGGWGGWPTDGKMNLKTKTSVYLDGKPEGNQFSNQGPMGTMGAVYTHGLKRGKHTVRVLFEYEFTYQGVPYSGSFTSKGFHFRIVKNTHEDLLKANDSPELEALVKASFHTAETEEQLKSQLGPKVLSNYFYNKKGMEPQSTVHNMVTGLQTALHCPYWAIAPGLPVDMIFDVTIEDLTTGKNFMGNSIRVHKNTMDLRTFEPNSPAQFANRRTGTIPIKVTLKPSQRGAWSYTWPTSYYPGTLTFTGLYITLVTTQGKPGNMLK